MIDVMANTVGALVLLAILATLNVSTVKTPFYLTRSAPVTTAPIHYVVSNNQVCRLDLPKLLSFLEGLPNGEQTISTVPDIPFSLQVEKTPDTTNILFQPHPPVAGQGNLSQTIAGQGETAQEIINLDSKQFHVIFWMDAKHFDAYTMLRKLCHEHEIQVGWELWSGVLSTSNRASKGGAGLNLNQIEK